LSGRVYGEREGRIGWIYFDHPERRNAISSEMWRAIPPLAAEFDEDPEIRVVVMRGTGEVAFVAGADISEFGQVRSGSGASDYDAQNGRAFGALASLRKPLIAMIHGFCVGGGCAIALTADLRFVADDGVFAIPAARLGLGYAAGGLQSLVNVVGFAAAKEIFFTARRFDAEEAQRMGLVNAVVPKAELEAHVRKVAEGIADNAPLTVASAKFILGELAKDADQRNGQAMNETIARCYASGDYAEGVKAFLEKRPPEFQGK